MPTPPAASKRKPLRAASAAVQGLLESGERLNVQDLVLLVLRNAEITPQRRREAAAALLGMDNGDLGEAAARAGGGGAKPPASRQSVSKLMRAAGRSEWLEMGIAATFGVPVELAFPEFYTQQPAAGAAREPAT